MSWVRIPLSAPFFLKQRHKGAFFVGNGIASLKICVENGLFSDFPKKFVKNKTKNVCFLLKNRVYSSLSKKL